MGACYTPPCMYSMPEHFAERARNQGVSVSDTVIVAQVADRAGDSDQSVHDFLNTLHIKLAAAVIAGQGG